MQDPNGNNAGIVMYTTSWCPACWQAKQVMKSMDVEYQEINISDDEEASEAVQRMNNGYRSVPTIVFPDGSILTEPQTTTLVNKLQALV
ncbi:MAG: thioredoxin fold domain-containing protein [Caldilineaceae bacterium]|nr:thioredoxin fold domain-containing protein [Caldilineaceae bacterium]